MKVPLIRKRHPYNARNSIKRHPMKKRHS
jgi:hypothetical protein